MNVHHGYSNQNVLLDNNRRRPYSLKVSEGRNKRPYNSILVPLMYSQSGMVAWYYAWTNSSVDPLMNAKSGDAWYLGIAKFGDVCYFNNNTTVYMNYSRIGGKSKQYNVLLNESRI